MQTCQESALNRSKRRSTEKDREAVVDVVRGDDVGHIVTAEVPYRNSAQSRCSGIVEHGVPESAIAIVRSPIREELRAVGVYLVLNCLSGNNGCRSENSRGGFGKELICRQEELGHALKGSSSSQEQV